jgi:hypothetical protein
MTSEELADQVESVVLSLRGRILGVGAEQYDLGTEQLIESKTDLSIYSDTLEELDDAIIYLAVLRARVLKLRELLALS